MKFALWRLRIYFLNSPISKSWFLGSNYPRHEFSSYLSDYFDWLMFSGKTIAKLLMFLKNKFKKNCGNDFPNSVHANQIFFRKLFFSPDLNFGLSRISIFCLSHMIKKRVGSFSVIFPVFLSVQKRYSAITFDQGPKSKIC